MVAGDARLELQLLINLSRYGADQFRSSAFAQDENVQRVAGGAEGVAQPVDERKIGKKHCDGEPDVRRTIRFRKL